MTLEIKKVFENLEIKPNSTVLLHGDAIVAAQYKIEYKKKIPYFYKKIINFFGNQGTIVIPSFNQNNFIKKNFFDAKKTPTTIGLFYEKFRIHKLATRTNHPLFSFVIFGKNKDKFLNSKITDCFGENTVFDILYKENAKILNIGCKWQCSFVHYVEQKINVNYRYFKNFTGRIKINNKFKKIKVSYYVRHLKKKIFYNLDKLEKQLVKKKKIRYANFGRFEVSCVNTLDVFNFASRGLKLDNNFLIANEK